MPKRCAVLSCQDESAARDEHRTYYKFPLHDPRRLQQWLQNMGPLEGWSPSTHHYICHQHFTDSCFKVSWGVRHLDHHAVPTVFKASEKRKETVDLVEKAAKYRRGNGNLRIPELPEVDNTVRGDGSIMDTLHFYNINVVDASQSEKTLLVESHADTEEALGGCKNYPRAETFHTVGTDLRAALCHTAEGLTCLDAEGNAQVLVIADASGHEVQEQLLGSGFTHGHQLLTTDSRALAQTEASSSSSSSFPGRMAVHQVTSGRREDKDEGEDEASLSDGGQQVTQVIAYFETIPNVFPVNGRRRAFSTTDTVLSSALGYKPITSTLPIVSKYVPPPLPASPETGGETGTDSDEVEKPGMDSEKQLEEHCYFRSSRLTKGRLEAAVSHLQRKVKVLQQRHRRHLDKLLGLEATVGQLRRHNLLHEERLQLLEKAYLQTSAVVSDAGKTVAIGYDEDSVGTLLQSPLSDVDDDDDDDE